MTEAELRESMEEFFRLPEVQQRAVIRALMVSSLALAEHVESNAGLVNPTTPTSGTT